jgi:Cu/Ag efflux protein CusF
MTFSKENDMKLSVFAIVVALVATGASAQQAMKGTIAKVDEPNGTISIQQSSTGTVGANSVTTAEDFRVRDGLMFNALRMGDKVTFSVELDNGAKTITQ